MLLDMQQGNQRLLAKYDQLHEKVEQQKMVSGSDFAQDEQDAVLVGKVGELQKKANEQTKREEELRRTIATQEFQMEEYQLKVQAEAGRQQQE